MEEHFTSSSINYEKVLEAAKYVEEKLTAQNILFNPTIGLICGTGLSILSLAAEQKASPICYRDIPHYPFYHIDGHEGQLHFGRQGNSDVIVFSGRTHSYQGYSLAETVFPVRLMKLLGVKQIVITNVAGAINTQYEIGDFVLLKDHINFAGLAGRSPLAGENDDRFGPRYFPIVHAYSPQLRSLAMSVTRELGEEVHEGVYAVVGGPNFESVAEVKMLRLMGADLVGMSTVSEVLAAVHANLEVLAISLVTNVCVDSHGPQEGDSREVLEEVLTVVENKKVSFFEFITKLLQTMSS